MRSALAWLPLMMRVPLPSAAQTLDWSGYISSSIGTNVWSCSIDDSCPLVLPEIPEEAPHA